MYNLFELTFLKKRKSFTDLKLNFPLLRKNFEYFEKVQQKIILKKD